MLNNSVDKIIQIYLDKIKNELPDLLSGFYLYGSVTMNDFHENKSDIDFIAIIENPLTLEERNKLKLIHENIESIFIKPNMNGIYIDSLSLGKSKSEIAPIFAFVEGKSEYPSFFELNYITWYQLKINSLTIFGKNPNELNFNVDWKDLIYEMNENINDYWYKWNLKIKNNDCVNDDEIEWGVLGVSRQYYSFLFDEIVSKSYAGEKLLEILPDKFKKIVNEAIRIRQGHIMSLYKNETERKNDLTLYISFIINESNKIFNAKYEN